MAGRPLEAMALIGLGYRSISMAPVSIGPVKSMVLSLDAGALQRWMAAVVQVRRGQPARPAEAVCRGAGRGDLNPALAVTWRTHFDNSLTFAEE